MTQPPSPPTSISSPSNSLDRDERMWQRLEEMESNIPHPFNSLKGAPLLHKLIDWMAVVKPRSAKEKECKVILKWLIEKSDHLEIKHSAWTSATPLMSAASYNNPYAVKLLLKAGASIHAVDDSNTTLLMYAIGDMARSRDPFPKDLLKNILERGADLSIQDEDNQTIIDQLQKSLRMKNSLKTQEERQGVKEYLEILIEHQRKILSDKIPKSPIPSHTKIRL